MTYVGIDPGKGGALAIITSDDVKIIAFSEQGYATALKEITDDCIVCVERVHAVSGQGIVSTFSFGENFGFIRGLLTAYRIPYQLIDPYRWKKEFGATAAKTTSIEIAQRLFPNTSLTKPAGRKPNDGFAEALLMAEFARRKLS